VDYACDLFAKKAKFPVFKTNLIGHGAANFPIVINSQAEISMLENNRFNLTTQLSE
jgi:muramoyltetrapeptide carboxypeptidase LdcA involved in peptidoglycan recycling